MSKSVEQTKTGDLDFGPEAAIDYNEVVLRWMDRYVRGIDNGVEREGPVRLFVMGENRWHDTTSWPPSATDSIELFLIGSEQDGTGSGILRAEPPDAGQTSSSFRSDPSDPVSDPYGEFGPHDYSALANRHDLVIFDSEPLANDLEVTGAMTAEIYFCCDCRDLDLWVKVLDVRPDGTAHNLMSPGLDVQRASYRAPDKGRQLLKSGEIYRLQFPHLITSNLFRQGHRIRVQISGAFFPHFSRNLQTGALETISAEMQPAEITIHHRPDQSSRLILPVVPRR